MGCLNDSEHPASSEELEEADSEEEIVKVDEPAEPLAPIAQQPKIEQLNTSAPPGDMITTPMTPTMTPLLTSESWDMHHDPNFSASAFACPPLGGEDLASLTPLHTATPVSKGEQVLFSPAMNIEDMDSEALSFLISPGKQGSPFKLSPIKGWPPRPSARVSTPIYVALLTFL